MAHKNCDGCARKLPVVNGNHVFMGHVVQYCTAYLYEKEQTVIVPDVKPSKKP